MRLENKKIAAAQTVFVSFALALSLLSLAAFILPLGASFAPLFFSGNVSNPQFFTIVRVAFRTIAIAFFSTLLATFVGVSLAFFLTKRNFFGKQILYAFSSVPLCIPTLALALGEVSIFGVAGIFNRVLLSANIIEKPLTLLYTKFGLIFVQGFYNFPIVMLLTAEKWKSVSTAEEEAARMLGASERRIFFSITLKKIAPAIIASSIPVFIYCFFTFILVLLFSAPGTETLEVLLYRAARITLDFKTASFIALVETLCALAIVFCYGFFSKKKVVSFSRQNIKTSIACALYETKTQKILEITFAAFLFLLIFVFFLLPLFGIAGAAFQKTEHTIAVIKLFSSRAFYTALKGSMETAPVTAILCTITGTAFSFILHFSKIKKQNLLKTLFMLPMAISSVALGYGLTQMIRASNKTLLIFLQSSLVWPFAFRQIESALSSLGNEKIEAALLLSENKFDGIFRVCIPSLSHSLFASFAFCFAISLGDTALPLVLSIPNFDTLSLYTYRLAATYKFGVASASALFVSMLASIFFMFGKIKITRRKK